MTMAGKPSPILDTQAAQYGFTVQHLAVQPPGLDQKATWLRVKVAQPDWVILRSTGVMTPTALKEAAQVGFPRDKIVGPSRDLRGAGHGAGRGGGHWLHLRAPGTARGPTSRSSRRCSHYVYARGKGPGPESDVGTVRLDPGHAARLAHHGGASARPCATSATSP